MNNRRNFLKNTALASAGTFLPLEIIASLRTRVGANDKINVGVIGCKGQGWNNLTAFLKISEINCLALCDIDDSIINQRKADLAKAGIGNPIIYKDYRKMLENKDIDFVIVATPDHWHCLQLTDALSAGKNVFCEKPIANSIGGKSRKSI
jgi:predicted dehydrogenase